MSYKNGDKISINLANLFSAYKDVDGEYYQDENGNVEIHIPETENYTDFYVKLPKMYIGVDLSLKEVDKLTK